MNLVELAESCGATHAALLTGEQVVLDRMFRDMCAANTCGNYGQCYMCPPDVGDIDELMRKVRCYRSAVLFQTISSLEDSFDFEGMTEAGKRHAQVSQAIRRALREASFAHLLLSAGGCRVCETCAKRDKLPCRFPELAMPSLESYGVNVNKTAQNANLRYINGANTVTYFGMILWDPCEE